MILGMTTGSDTPSDYTPGVQSRELSTQNSLPSGSVSTTQEMSVPWPMSAGAAPRAVSRSTSAAWSSPAHGATSTPTRFLATLGSPTRRGSSRGPGPAGLASDTELSSRATSVQPLAATQNGARANGSGESSTTAAIGPAPA